MKIALAALLAVATLPAFAQNTAAPPAVLGAQGGRFVFGQISPYRRDQFLLDTQTGRLWAVVCMKRDEKGADCEQSGLQPVFFFDFSGNPTGNTPPPGAIR